jgi:hypothetical protein
MVNYGKLVRMGYKTFCKNEYKNDAFLAEKIVHADINKNIIRIGHEKLSKILSAYKVVKNGEVCYRNPYRYEEAVLSMVENLMGVNISPPAGIDYRPDIQIKEGRTPDELSMEMKRKYNINISPAQIRSVIRKSSSKRIREGREGAAGHFYVSPD